MDILKTGAELLGEKLGIQGDLSNLTEALSGLLGGSGKELDLTSIVQGLMSNNNLQGLVTSWLGDGPNSGIDASMVTQFFGNDKISEFASKVGVQGQEAAQGLASVLPQMIDKASKHGELLGSVGGGLGDLLNKGMGLFK